MTTVVFDQETLDRTTEIYAKLQSNSVILADPSELHFSGFELGKDYCRLLKLINTSSDVINIHILPTQTKYFRTTYSKKHRLVPGLSYTVKVHFCPDEWRYFYDCIRLHCKGEEHVLVPVHAYPIIDDLHVPSHVSLPAVPLGQSVSHIIPLSCSCPVDFDFQVNVLQSHPAFSIQPLSGIIPSGGRAEVTVTFAPLRYGSSQVTLQLLVSQFNARPFVCTLSGASWSRLAARSHQERDTGHAEETSTEASRPPPSSLTRPLTKAKLGSIRTPEKTKAVREQREADVQPSLRSKVDLLTPAGVAKMLIQPTDKMSSRDLREAMSQSHLGQQTRQMREAFFENKVRQDVQEERAGHLRWQVHLGKDPLSAKTRLQILEERDGAGYEYTARDGQGTREGGLSRGRPQPQLSVRRILRSVGQAPAVLPAFRVYTGSQLEVRHRALRLFQQAARKVVMRCRMNARLACLRTLKTALRPAPAAEERPDPLKIPPQTVSPFSFPVFSLPEHDDELAPNALRTVSSEPVDVSVEPHVPFFSLKVPQHYKLMGYQPVSVYEAMASYVPPTLPRTLRTGAEDELLPAVLRPPSPGAPPGPETRPQEAEPETPPEAEPETPGLSFTAPRALLDPPHAHPLRVFNPAPGLHAFRPTPLYLESDLEFHLCPLPRYTVRQGGVVGVHAPTTQKSFLDRADVIRGVMTWKKFPSAALATLSSTPTLTSNWTPRLSDPFGADLLPVTAPPPLRALPQDMTEELLDGPCESAAASLSPEMVWAEFPGLDGGPSRPARDDSAKDNGSCLSPCRTPQPTPLSTGTTSRECGERELQRSLQAQTNRLGAMVTARLGGLKMAGKAHPPPPSQEHKHASV